MNKSLIILLLSIFSTNLYASFTASNFKNINSSLPTHLIIIGHPDKLGGLFVNSALTKSQIYSDISTNDQVIILGRDEDRLSVKNAGYNIIEAHKGLLRPGVIKEAIKEIKLLSSIDIYAHTNPYSGATLDNNTWVMPFLNESDDLWDEVINKINNSSFVFIHGCSSGFTFAPTLASKLKIAVFASLTATDFQYQYNKSFWSFEYNIKNLKKSSKNIVRMKPNNSTYKGHWGNWSAGGYPSYKLFCGTNDNSNCELGAIEGIATFPSFQSYHQVKQNNKNYKNQLEEFLCPYGYDLKKQQICKINLEKSLNENSHETYSPFRGKTLVCDRERCKAHFNCSRYNIAFHPEKCSLESETSEESTTFTDEYKYLMNIYNQHNSN
jgi:hypothetical protein